MNNNGYQQWGGEAAGGAAMAAENYESQGQDLRQGPDHHRGQDLQQGPDHLQGQESAAGSDGEYQVATSMGQNPPHASF